MKRRKVSKKLNCLKTMPPLYHKLPNEEFSFEKSEVINFIKNQPELFEWLWIVAKDWNLIEYDKNTGKWQGIEFEKRGDK